jgi:Flp pilus assembly protein TadB
VLRFRFSGLGNGLRMIGLGIALVLVGIILLFILPWVGIPIGIVGLVLAILWFVGVSRGRQPGDRRM